MLGRYEDSDSGITGVITDEGVHDAWAALITLIRLHLCLSCTLQPDRQFTSCFVSHLVTYFFNDFINSFAFCVLLEGRALGNVTI